MAMTTRGGGEWMIGKREERRGGEGKGKGREMGEERERVFGRVGFMAEHARGGPPVGGSRSAEIINGGSSRSLFRNIRTIGTANIRVPQTL